MIEGERSVSTLPARVSPGNCFGIIAPAGPARLDAEQARRWFMQRGYDCHLYPGVDEAQGYLAGCDERRLSDLHAAFADPAIAAVMCMRGGYGSMRLLEGLDIDLLRDNPKPFIGYSDATALHTVIQQHAGFVTFHGAMLNADLLGDKQEPTASSLLQQLRGELGAGEQILHPQAHPLTCVLPGSASGRLVGGNLSLLNATLGTLAEVQTHGSILFIEDVNEPLYRVDRLLTQLRLAGKLHGVRGVLAGDFAGISVAALTPLLLEIFGPLEIPVLAGWRSGHCDPNICLPLGAQVTLDSRRPGLRLDQALFRE